MGLSDNERIIKAAWASNRITELAYQLDPEHDDWEEWETRQLVKRLKKLCLELIPTMGASKGNSLFWLFGSDDEVTSEKSTPFSLAVYDKIRYAMTPEARKELNAKKKKKPDMWGKEIRKEDRDLFEIQGYLSNQAKVVYDIYQWRIGYYYQPMFLPNPLLVNLPGKKRFKKSYICSKLTKPNNHDINKLETTRKNLLTKLGLDE